MAMTLAEAEAELVARTADLLTLLGIDATPSGSNAFLDGCLAYGIGRSGGTVASRSALTDDDVATVDEADIDQMLDLAEYRALSNCRNRWVEVRTRMGTTSEVYASDIRDSLDRRLAQLWKQLKDQYGVGLGTLTSGVIALPVAATDADQTAEFG